MFTDGAYPNGAVSIIANIAAHTSDGLATFINDYNVMDTASAASGTISFTTAVSASKTTSARDGVINIQYTTDANTSGTAYIILKVYRLGLVFHDVVC